ncbi:MAG TPA: recombinase RecA [Porphyromonadaceae bacterium]|nr:recombinase RecA [Porphyromonadaceae bacterium]
MAKKKTGTASSARISDTSEKLKALDMAMAHLEKDFGKGSIMRLGDDSVQDVEVISTGSIGLDYALGVGGLPRGRVTEIYGPESSGKTTLAIHVIAEAQKQGGICAIIDAEHAFDRFYAEKLGVDVNNLWIAQPDNGEQALDIAEQLINSGAIDVLVVDSVAALTPKAEIEGEMGDKNVGLHARLMSQAMRKLTGTISRTRTCCIFINQMREKIGVMFGNPETTTGGNALKFYASVRIEIRPSSLIKDGEDVIGRVAKVKVVKNKVAPPFMKAEFDIMFGEGISKSGEILDMAVEHGIIKKSGAWFSYENAKLGQGRDAVKRVIADNAELADELADKIRAKLKQERDEKHGTTAAPFNPYLPSKDNQRVEEETPADEGLAIEDDPYDEDFSVEIED